MLVKILKIQFHENLLTFLTVMFISGILRICVEYPVVMMSEDTDMKFACGQIRSEVGPWKILVHKLLALENWPVIHYLSRASLMKLTI